MSYYSDIKFKIELFDQFDRLKRTTEISMRNDDYFDDFKRLVEGQLKSDLVLPLMEYNKMFYKNKQRQYSKLKALNRPGS